MLIDFHNKKMYAYLCTNCLHSIEFRDRYEYYPEIKYVADFVVQFVREFMCLCHECNISSCRYYLFEFKYIFTRKKKDIRIT